METFLPDMGNKVNEDSLESKEINFKRM